MMRILALFTALGLLCAAQAEASVVVVFSASPAGIAAAVAARRTSGNTTRVVVIEPSHHVGGMLSGGMHDDSTQGQILVYAGISREVYHIRANQNGHFGPNDVCYDSLPSTIESAFEELAVSAGVELVLAATICSVAVQGRGTSAAAITSVSLCNGTVIAGDMFIDASYEGDLMALAGAPFALGREDSREFNESFAGVLPSSDGAPYGFQGVKVSPYTVSGDNTSGLLPLVCDGDTAAMSIGWLGTNETCLPGGGVAGSGDGRVQSFNLRACLTTASASPAGPALPIPVPESYNSSDWELLRRYVKAKSFGSGTGVGQGVGGYVSCTSMADSSCDTNDSGAISINQIGWQWAWPTASYEQRARLLEDHVTYTASLIHFLATDAAVPTSVQKEAQGLRLCGGQFNGSAGHWPWMTYVREGRRLRGAETFTQTDYAAAVGAPSSEVPRGVSGLGGPLNVSVGLGFWFLDCHEVQRAPSAIDPDSATVNEGQVEWGRTEMDDGATFGIPYGILVTEAPGATSATSSNAATAGATPTSSAGYGYVTDSQSHRGASFSKMLLSHGSTGGHITPDGFEDGASADGRLGNLLVPVCVSSTHVGFNPLRIEPTYMVMGQAAGTAAALAIEHGTTVQGVSGEALQASLRAQGVIADRADVATAPKPNDVC
jgi:hypothetical protein